MRRTDIVTLYLEVCGIALITIFTFVIWPPLSLLTVGTFALLISRHMSPRG